MAANGERQINVAGVGDGERLRQRGIARDCVGHVELEVIWVGLESLGGVAVLERHRRPILSHADDGVLRGAGEAVAFHAAGAL